MKLKLPVKQITSVAKEHLPEILTIISVLGVGASDALFIMAAKKEDRDGSKKHYILPIIVSGVTVGCIIASNRVSNSQKASLAAAGALMADNYYKQRQVIKQVCMEEQQDEIDELLIMACDAYKDDKAFVEGKKLLYYLPQFNIVFWSDPETVTMALTDVNTTFAQYGEVYLAEFLCQIGILKLEYQILGEQLKWRINNDDIENGIKSITYNAYTKMLKNGQECHYIEFDYMPVTEDLWQLEYNDIGM